MKFEENEKIEFKGSMSAENEIMESICALANAKGGEIYIGISDKGKVLGVHLGKNTMENLSKKIREGIKPPPAVNISKRVIESKEIIRITVPESEYKPHFYKGRGYMRVGKTNRRIEPDELELLFLRKFSEIHKIANRVLDEAKLSDIDEDSIREYSEKIDKKYLGMVNSLKNLGLMKNKKLLAPALLFFGKKPEKFFPLYGVKCAVFSGEEPIEMKDFRGNIYKMTEKVVNYIINRIPSRIKIEGIRRVEEPLISKEAIREAVLNSLIHRNYGLSGSNYVIITKEKIEIKNKGGLPPGLTIKQLYSIHNSEPQNPRLAELAYKIGWIEQWGTGTLKIIKSMRERGLEDPIFKEESGMFIVVLSMQEIELNKRQKRILEIIKRDGSIKADILSKRFKVSKRTIYLDLQKLSEKGFLKKQKKGRRIYYER